jgi:pilus assembly protein CpaB
MVNRPADGNTTFSTGGDVSRFQRRSVPAKPADKTAQLAQAMSGLGKGIGQALGMSGGTRSANGGVRVVRGNDDGGAR